jgi:hypothetical protein
MIGPDEDLSSLDHLLTRQWTRTVRDTDTIESRTVLQCPLVDKITASMQATACFCYRKTQFSPLNICMKFDQNVYLSVSAAILRSFFQIREIIPPQHVSFNPCKHSISSDRC